MVTLEETNYESMEEVEEHKDFIVKRVAEHYKFNERMIKRKLNSENLTPQEVKLIVTGRVPIGIFGKPFTLADLFNFY